MLKVLELFGGIGAPRKALENLGIDVKSIDYVEILPHAVSAYNSMFDNTYKPQDIRTWNLNVDVLIHGSPCQDWSKNGKNDVSTGRSILYERTLEILDKELNPRPKVVIWENVTGLVSKRHIDHFNHYLSSMERMGYKNKFKILNSKNYGMAQNRERIFTISVLEDREFEFPKEIELEKTLSHYIDTTIDPTEYLLSENEMSLFFWKDGKLHIHENNKKGYREVNEFDSINIERPNSTTRRGRVGSQIVQTLTTSSNMAVYYDKTIRRLTPREHWRLMGFTDSDFDSIEQNDIPKSAQYKLAGNSIVVNVLECIFKELITQKFIILDHKPNIKLVS